MTDLDAATLEGVAFLGNTLAPFFLQDPRTGSAEAELAAAGRKMPPITGDGMSDSTAPAFGMKPSTTNT